MKKLIVPDVHLKLNRLKSILKNADSFDQVVFLGDFFDAFIEGQKGRCTSIDMAKWLKENLYNPKYKFLFGNHDYAYFQPGYFLSNMCGFTRENFVKINDILSFQDWMQFKMFDIIKVDGDDDIIISHAGFHASQYPFKFDLLESFRPYDCNPKHPWVRPGRDRGFPDQPIGGPLWCHWDNCSDIKGIRQIVGHTHGEFPRRTMQNLCIDTGLNFVAIVENGNVTVDQP